MLLGWMHRDRGEMAQLADRGDAWGGAALQEPQECDQAEGICAGTLVATERGWQPVEAIRVGDMVLTFDHGSAQVLEVTRGALWSGWGACPRALWPVAVPVGVLGNKRTMLVPPEQLVMIESDVAEDLFGDPFSLVPAAALEGYRGITRVAPHGMIEVVTLRFAEDQVVYANGSGMLHCAALNRMGIVDELAGYRSGCDYVPLSLDRARRLIGLMIEEDEGTAPFRAAPKKSFYAALV